MKAPAPILIYDGWRFDVVGIEKNLPLISFDSSVPTASLEPFPSSMTLQEHHVWVEGVLVQFFRN